MFGQNGYYQSPYTAARQTYYPQPAAFPQTVPAVPQQDAQMGGFNAGGHSGFQVIPVASYDEAKAIPTDFAGNTLILLDLSHGMIYTKAIDVSNGTSVFRTYRIQEAEPTASSNDFDARSEIEKLKKDLEHVQKELGLTAKEGE